MKFAINFFVIIYITACFLQFRYCQEQVTVGADKDIHKVVFMPTYKSTWKIRVVVKGYLNCPACLNIDPFYDHIQSPAYLSSDTIMLPPKCQKTLPSGKIDTVFVQDWHYVPGVFVGHSPNCATKSELYIKYSFVHVFI